jgi:co-chaperonin GroES (HSP10)
VVYFLQKTNVKIFVYTEANVLSAGKEVEGLKEGDKIFFDRHAGHKIEIDKKTYHVIKAQDVVVVL